MNNTKENQNKHDLLIRCICKDIAKGVNRRDIIQKGINDEYGVGQKYTYSTMGQYATEAKKIITDQWKEEMKGFRDQIKDMYLDTYNDAREHNDRIAAVQSLKELGKIAGCYDPETINLSVQGELVIDFGFESDDEEEEIDEDESQIQD